MNCLPIDRIAIALVALAALALPAMAATETVLYSFPNSGTGYPSGTLYFRNGSLYGTGAGDGNAGDGQVFKLTNSGGAWKENTLVTFDGANGSTPFAGLIRDSNGVLYGTTWTGDAYNGGNVFALYKSGGKWISSTIWAFGGTSGDGTQPECDLVMDKSGNLYGTTYGGGAYNLGTVFELSKVNGVWAETVLHSFGANGVGWEPYAGLLMDGSGTFYGTTIYGGNHGNGTIFKLFQSGGVWKFKSIYSFTGGSDGSEPLGTLIRDKNGALYGTTYAGGAPDTGVAFMLSRSGGKWTETVLHVFNWQNGDGYNPLAGLRWSPSGGLYGTTPRGGSPGGGTVFELTPGAPGGVWTESILHGFAGNADGSYPQGRVTLDENGALYGTTEIGGTDNLGTVWKIIP
ncbi:MAG TPA: choice-of-anchor tandem repeat GloVer-containing protein [Rhizomicrobium sp.]|nr:choice-of-anchor tandem repeat GloVer-containing protein [Rhizomicrobium sp.]